MGRDVEGDGVAMEVKDRKFQSRQTRNQPPEDHVLDSVMSESSSKF